VSINTDGRRFAGGRRKAALDDRVGDLQAHAIATLVGQFDAQRVRLTDLA
jgi:hypothetical protein